MELKKKTSLMLSPTMQRLLGALAERMGISKSDVLEVVVREAAEKRGIPLDVQPGSKGAGRKSSGVKHDE